MPVSTEDPEIRDQQRKPEPPPPEQQEDRRSTEEKGKGWIRENPIKAVIGLIVVLAAAIGVFVWWQYSQTYESTDDAFIDGHLSSVSARVQGTVTAVYVQENQFVAAGQTLVELDPRDWRVNLDRAKADLAQAQASVSAQNPAVPIATTSTQTGIAQARAQLANAEAGVAAAERDRDAEVARLTQAEANNSRAQADLARYSQLVNKDEVSREEYDQRVAAARSAAATVDSQRAAIEAANRIIDQRRAQVEAARASLGEASSNASAQVAVQRATVQTRQAAAQASKAALDQAVLNLQYTKIFAPVAGVVGRRSAEVGQRVQPGQELVSIVQLNDIWVTANFKETQLRRMRPGQSVTIHVDAFGRDYDGYLESLPAASGARFSLLPPENATGNYVKVVQRLPVRIRFKPGQDAEQRLRPGMSVVPKVWL